ncbi:MAG: hypothetical protein ABJD53_14725 [Gammaproteobacteria bacterium]
MPDDTTLDFEGSTAGGARPKATVCDATGNWIAKFPGKILDGRFDVTGLEKATMDCRRASRLVERDS